MREVELGSSLTCGVKRPADAVVEAEFVHEEASMAWRFASGTDPRTVKKAKLEDPFALRMLATTASHKSQLASAAANALTGLRRDLMHYPMTQDFMKRGDDERVVESPTQQRSFVNKLRARGQLDAWVRFNDGVQNSYADSIDQDTGFSHDWDYCFGGSSRFLALGRRTLGQAGAAHSTGDARTDAACARVNARLEQLAASTGMLDSLAEVRECAPGSVWRADGRGKSTKGAPTQACTVAWPVLMKAVHFYMLDNTNKAGATHKYTWVDVSGRARCLYGLFANLHATLGRAGTVAEQDLMVRIPTKQMSEQTYKFFGDAYGDGSSTAWDKEMAPYGGVFYVEDHQRSGQYVAFPFSSFKWKHIDWRNRQGLPKMLYNHYTTHIEPYLGGKKSTAAHLLSDWHRSLRGADMSGSGSRDRHRNKKPPQPFPKARGWIMKINGPNGIPALTLQKEPV